MYCREIIGMCVLGFSIFIGANLLSREIQEVFLLTLLSERVEPSIHIKYE